MRGNRRIIKTHDRQFTRDFDAAFTSGVKCPGRHFIVAREDRGGPGYCVQDAIGRFDTGIEAVRTARYNVGGHFEAVLPHRGKEAFTPLHGRAEAFRPLNNGDAPVTHPMQMIDDRLDHFAIIRLYEMFVFIERRRAHTDITAAHIPAKLGKLVILRNGRQYEYSVKSLEFEETTNIGEHVR